MTRYVTRENESPMYRAWRARWDSAYADPTPIEYDIQDDPERFRLYRLCECGECDGTGKIDPEAIVVGNGSRRCKACRGEGRSLDLVATCGTPEAVGVALVTLGREGEWEGCQFGVLDSSGAKNEKWLVRPWLASPTARNVSDAARVLARSPRKSSDLSS